MRISLAETARSSLHNDEAEESPSSSPPDQHRCANYDAKPPYEAPDSHAAAMHANDMLRTNNKSMTREIVPEYTSATSATALKCLGETDHTGLRTQSNPKDAKAALVTQQVSRCWPYVLERKQCGAGDRCGCCLELSRHDQQYGLGCVRISLADLVPYFVPREITHLPHKCNARTYDDYISNIVDHGLETFGDKCWKEDNNFLCTLWKLMIGVKARSTDEVDTQVVRVFDQTLTLCRPTYFATYLASSS